MSFTDPLSITISGTTVSLPRVSVGDDRSEYASGDGLYKLTASHEYGRRTRRLMRIDTSKVAPDPFRPTENVQVGMSYYVVFDLPPAGYTAAEALAVQQGFNTLMAANTNQLVTKLLGGES